LEKKVLAPPTREEKTSRLLVRKVKAPFHLAFLNHKPHFCKDECLKNSESQHAKRSTQRGGKDSINREENRTRLFAEDLKVDLGGNANRRRIGSLNGWKWGSIATLHADNMKERLPIEVAAGGKWFNSGKTLLG